MLDQIYIKIIEIKILMLNNFYRKKCVVKYNHNKFY